MSDKLPPLPPGLTLVKEPPLPDGLTIVKEAPPRPALSVRPTGEAHDGDTFRLEDGRNARLYGADAFELRQQGLTRDGQPVALGAMARDYLGANLSPSSTVALTGAMTYGRPVASLSSEGQDVARGELDKGLALATPEYLRADPGRLHDYMEAERLARLNRRGAHAVEFQSPSDFRHGKPDPWAKPEYSDTAKPGDDAVFFDEATPFQGLRPDIAAGYVKLTDDPESTPADAMAYAKANGFDLDAADVQKFYAARDKGAKPSGGVTYKDRPRLLTDLGDGKLGATLRGLADPLNMLDEAGAVVDTLGGTNGRESLFNSDRRFGDILANNLDQNRSILSNDDATNPYYRLGGQVASGLALPGATLEGVGFGAARAALRGGGTRLTANAAARAALRNRMITAGGVEGALTGFGAGEGWEERGKGAVIGGGVGAALGGVLGVGGQALFDLRATRSAGRGVKASEAVVTDGAERSGPATPPIAEALPEQANPSRLKIDAAGASREPNVAAMDAEYAGETLTAPDLGVDIPPLPPGRTLVDGGLQARAPLREPSEAERVAMEADIAPGDVLPVPANTIASVDEAAGINAGMYAPVKAPNEADALASRSIPSPKDGTKTIAKRGPLDLVTWLRSQGGIRAQGGELEHYGIVNTPRAGMDFAGGENRFGPLVSNSGMNYDEAAMRAHEAGFFPDHVERPTVDEFLDTLNGTHTGRNRAFRTDDLAEVDAYEAQRALRHSVEGARERGAPLVEDRAQPADLADMDRNAAPVTAYEEWGENAPRMAGNLRLDKLDSPQSIRRALADTHARVGGFDAATRGRITQGETERLASELGMTASDLLKRRKGQALNAEEALAARQILAKSGNELVNMARRVSREETPSDADMAAFRQAWVRHVAIQEQVAGATAEAGRALSQFRMMGDARAVNSEVLAALGEAGGGRDRVKAAAGMILDSADDPGLLSKVSTKALRPKLSDKLVELYYNNMLSGPATHAVNITSNTMTALGQLPEHAVGALLGAVRGVAKGDADRVLFSEIGARAVGLMQGTREGLLQAARTMRTGEPADFASKVEQQSMRAISGIKGSIIRTPTRALMAEDELFKAMARRMELAGLATRQASAEGLRGAAGKARVADLIANPTDDILAKSFDYGRYLTFQRPLGPMGQSISRLTQTFPLAKLVVPFIRTPTNILKFGAERSPLALVMPTWRADMKAGGARRDLAMAKVLVGTGTMALTLEMAGAGHITGGGPADPKALSVMRADGWQPYSLKWGDKYYSYQRLDPIATTLGVAADFADLQSHLTEKQQDHVAGLIVASTVRNLGNKTWLSGVSDAVEAYNDPDRFMDSYLRKVASGIIVPAGVAQVARTIDPEMKDAQSILDAVRARIPGQSQKVQPRLDVWGRPIAGEGGLGPDLVSPVRTSTRQNDPVNAEMLSSGAQIGKPSQKVGGAMLSEPDYFRYQTVAGARSHQAIQELIRGEGWHALEEETRSDAIEKAIKAVRKEVRGELFGGGKGPDVPALPPGLSMLPPLPPGLTLQP